MPEYAPITVALPDWPTEPEFVPAPRAHQPILPPGYVSAVGPDGSLIAIPVREQQVPATFAPAPVPGYDPWPKRMLAGSVLVGSIGVSGWFLFRALAAAEGALIALAVLGAMVWASQASKKSGGSANIRIENHNHNHVTVINRRGRFR